METGKEGEKQNRAIVGGWEHGKVVQIFCEERGVDLGTAVPGRHMYNTKTANMNTMFMLRGLVLNRCTEIK